MTKKKIAIWSIVFVVGFFYQPKWVYQNFYFNPRWVEDSWWSLNYWAFLLIYALFSVVFIEIIIRLIKKYAWMSKVKTVVWIYFGGLKWIDLKSSLAWEKPEIILRFINGNFLLSLDLFSFSFHLYFCYLLPN